MDNMKSYMIKHVLNHLQSYFDLIYYQGLALKINGVPAFSEKSQFVEGKVVNACSYVYESIPEGDPNKTLMAKKLTFIIDMMAEREFVTWGMLNCIIALHRLNEHQQLQEVVSENALATLKKKLDWRTFVNEEDLSLIDLPTNYYGVAFGVAKYRELLGFESGNYSERLLEKLLDHVDNFSGEFSYMDETNGQGRFDRYSILIPAEICSMLHNTGCDIPEKLTLMLRKSCDIYISIANNKGSGFSYGRSIGAYGDTAALEIFSIAAKLGILNKDELAIAYTYNTMGVKRFAEFWLDAETQSLNMWEKGRKTDNYRNISRILGENLSLAMQIVGCYEHWKSAGYENSGILPRFQDVLDKLPTTSTFKFAEGLYSRRLYTIRDKSHVFMLPLINGGDTFYKESAYLPIPNEFGVLTTPTNCSFPFLTPKLIFKDKSIAMPIAYIQNITDNLADQDRTVHQVNYELSAMAIIAGEVPSALKGITAKACYQFSSGHINFALTFSFNDIKISTLESIEMQFGSFSEKPRLENTTVHFESGAIKRFNAKGFDRCDILNVADNNHYHTPTGAINNIATFTLKESLPTLSEGTELTFAWVIEYS